MGLLGYLVLLKPTDSYQLLHKQSFHPRQTFSDLLKISIIRYDGICSDPKDLDRAF